MTSIRRYLTVALTAGIALLLAGTGWLVLAATRRALTQQFDEGLATKAQALIAAAEEDDGELEIDFDVERLAGFHPADGRDVFEIRQAGGAIALRSPALGQGRLPALPEPAGPEPSFHAITLPDGSPGRAVVQRFDAADDDSGRYRDAQLIVATRSGELERTLDLLAWVLAAAGLLAIALTVPIVRAVLRRGLAPLERLAARTSEIGAASLDRRLQVTELPVELQPIAAELNGLVARLQQSFERERRFSGDVAHELRTPLAELHTMAEMGSQWADQATPEAFGEVLAITREMEAMIVKLRQLASTEKGTQPMDPRPVDLAASIHAAWEPLREQASGRGIHLETTVAPVTIVTDPLLWRSILTNLLDNAVTYSPAGSAIRLEAAADHLAIRNPAGDLAPEDLPCLFDRFWRKDTARTGYGHSGLGLSLVRGFCELQGWRIRASLAPPPGSDTDRMSEPELEIRIDFDRRISDA
jgi:signal transduction histidine kinase